MRRRATDNVANPNSNGPRQSPKLSKDGPPKAFRLTKAVVASKLIHITADPWLSWSRKPWSRACVVLGFRHSLLLSTHQALEPGPSWAVSRFWRLFPLLLSTTMRPWTECEQGPAPEHPETFDL